eukprot:5853995-Pyramimonas_sp.AAC.1
MEYARRQAKRESSRPDMPWAELCPSPAERIMARQLGFIVGTQPAQAASSPEPPPLEVGAWARGQTPRGDMGSDTQPP